jgi:hypothetical protein
VASCKNVSEHLTKNSNSTTQKNFPTRSTKAGAFDGGRNVCSSNNEWFKKKMYSSSYRIWIIEHNPMMRNGSL